ncbi:MAG: hypothetical protein KIG85_01395 [Thiopseudomonas sp.]|nr:hypothetical protein [Thiopseudomonas sp.]
MIASHPYPQFRTRVAPSPTGDPHLGTAYIALFGRHQTLPSVTHCPALASTPGCLAGYGARARGRCDPDYRHKTG